MGNHALSLILLFAALASPGARADWNQASLKWATEFSAKPARFSDGNVASVWGAARAYLYDLRHPHYEQFAYQDRDFSSPIRLANVVQKEKGGAIAKRRLIVVFPGTFNNVTDPMSLRAMDRFAKLGFHVLVLPNPLGTQFVGAGFAYPPGSLEQEGAFMARAIQASVDRLGRAHISGIDWIGESYGAFLATVALGKGATPPASLTLVGPPLSFERAVGRLDGMIADNGDLYYSRCAGSFRLVRFVLDFLSAPFADKLPSRARDCSTSLLTFTGFQQKIVDTARAYDAAHRLGHVPRGGAELLRWKKSFNFSSFFRDFASTATPSAQDPRMDLGYWLNLARKAGGRRVSIRVISAVDDFLNTAEEWRSNRYFDFDRRRLILLPWGGHIGYVATDDYEEMMRLAFVVE